MNGLARLIQLAETAPTQIALQDERCTVSYGELLQTIGDGAEWLRQHSVHRMAVQLDNSVSFLLWDLAAQLADVVCVPLPLFFTSDQQQHVLNSAGIDLLLAPADLAATATHPITQAGFSQLALPINAALSATVTAWQRAVENPVSLPMGTSKITFTSGTTGTPKGVCLSSHNQWQVAQSLQSIASTLAIHHHLCVLPLAVLLENVAGVYSALLNGARVLLPSLASVGLHGSSQFEPRKLLAAVHQHGVNSIILLPQMLQAVLQELAQQPATPQLPSLRFVAVGGARVAPELLARADALQFPVYEGYGLSECASVVAVNAPRGRRAGTVGKPLPHVRIETQPDGEIIVHGNAFLGYLGANQNASPAQAIATGDLGVLDPDGYLRINGRKKNLLITGFGRNVSPEWPESELLAEPAIQQVAVFGEGKPGLCAVIVARTGSTAADCDAAVRRTNKRLPDYAQLQVTVVTNEAFRPDNGLLTSNGRPRRDAIWQRYRDALEQQYAATDITALSVA